MGLGTTAARAITCPRCGGDTVPAQLHERVYIPTFRFGRWCHSCRLFAYLGREIIRVDLDAE